MTARSSAVAGPSPQSYVLDTSAVLRYLDGESGAERVRDLLDQCWTGQCRLLMSAVNWGELASRLYRTHGPEFQAATMHSLLALGIEISPATAERAVNAGQIKARLKIPYADCFGIELALDPPARILLTADFDVKPAADAVHIEFLPVK